jgi:hypothetical protein
MAQLEMIIDDSSFLEHAGVLAIKVQAAKRKALQIVGDELLRLSQREVPFVTGELMNSGVSQADGDNWIVGYNKVYAAYMHEGHWFDGSHVIQHYSNNRKGYKYLEDPMKINREIFQEYFGATVRAELAI